MDEQLPDGRILVHVFNVGQGDSLLVEFPTGDVAVVDCYYRKSVDGTLPQVVRYLERKGIHDIGLLCLTHLDRDHYAGMSELIDWAYDNGGRVRNLVLCSGPTLAELSARVRQRYEQMLEMPGSDDPFDDCRVSKLQELNEEVAGLLRRLAKIRREVREADGFYARAGIFAHAQTFGDAHVFVLGPGGSSGEETVETALDAVIDAFFFSERGVRPGSENDHSCVLWIVMGQGRVLLTGDAGEATLQRAIRVYERNHLPFVRQPVSCQVVKVSHHGAASGSSVELWRTVGHPEGFSAIMSAGCHGRYRHPRQEVLDDLAACGYPVAVFCTNICPTRWESLVGCTAFPVAEAASWEDDTAPARLAQVTRGSDLRCHGDCTFEVFANGTVVSNTEVDNGACWYVCKGQDDVCFQQHAQPPK